MGIRPKNPAFLLLILIDSLSFSELLYFVIPGLPCMIMPGCLAIWPLVKGIPYFWPSWVSNLAKTGILSIFMAKLKVMNTLIGRKKELEQLQKLKANDSPAFLAVYGRRRVGKTFLIRQAFDNQFDFHLTGISNGS